MNFAVYSTLFTPMQNENQLAGGYPTWSIAEDFLGEARARQEARYRELVNENLQLRVKVDQFGQEKADWIHDFDKYTEMSNFRLNHLHKKSERRTDDLMEAHNQLRGLKKRLRDMQKERNMAKVEYEAGEH